MDNYQSHFEEEERPASRAGGRWLGGLIIGLILGGAIGFMIGGGNLGGFIENMRSGFAGESVSIVFTVIVIIGIAMLKSIGLRRNRVENAQSVRLMVLTMVIAITIALGVLFFAGR